MLLYPFHNYLGPGNKLPNGKQVDIDDYLAYLHDKEYVKGIIHDSDKHFARDFLSDYASSGNIHSLIGYIGLRSKYELEKYTGQLYPAMVKSKGKTTGELTRGQRAYAERQRQLGRDYQLARQRGFTGDWYSFMRSRGDRTTQVPPQEIVTPFSPQPGSSSNIERPNFSRGDYLDDDDLAAMERIFDESMHEQGSSAMDTSAVLNQQMATGGGGITTGPGGSSESANKFLNIPRSIGLKNITLNFRKSRIFYSYGYAFTSITKTITSGGTNPTDLGDEMQLCTPLACLPVDLLGFYIDPTEYNMIFGKATIIQVNVTVVPQGIRTAFDYGTSLSGTATSEHCSIGCSAIGLNTALYCKHGSYTSSSEKPMIPTAINDVVPGTILKKLYGTRDTDVPMNVGVPRHVDLYFAEITNNERDPSGANAGQYQLNPGLWPKLDNYISRWNFIPKIGEVVIDYKYKPVNGVIQWKTTRLPYSATDSDTAYRMGNINNIPMKINVRNRQEASTSKVNQTNVSVAVDPTVYTNANYYRGSYKLNALQCSIDPTKVMNLDNAPVRTKPIPLIYLGILPIPQLNPATDSTNFQNSCAYWSVVADMVIEVSPNSIYGSGKECVTGPTDNYFRIESTASTINNYTELYPGNLITYGN